MMRCPTDSSSNIAIPNEDIQRLIDNKIAANDRIGVFRQQPTANNYSIPYLSIFKYKVFLSMFRIRAALDLLYLTS